MTPSAPPFPIPRPADLAAPQPAPEALPKRFVMGISGASGAPYSLRLLELLLSRRHEVHLVVTDYGRRLLFDEAGIRELSLDHLVPSLPPPSAPPPPSLSILIRMWAP